MCIKKNIQYKAENSKQMRKIQETRWTYPNI